MRRRYRRGPAFGAPHCSRVKFAEAAVVARMPGTESYGRGHRANFLLAAGTPISTASYDGLGGAAVRSSILAGPSRYRLAGAQRSRRLAGLIHVPIE